RRATSSRAAPVAQPAEAFGSNPIQCGFESHPGHPSSPVRRSRGSRTAAVEHRPDRHAPGSGRKHGRHTPRLASRAGARPDARREVTVLEDVDPFVGTAATDLPPPAGLAATWWSPKPLVGNTHPGATYPLGMVSACAYSGAYPTGYGRYGLSTGSS